MREQFRLDPSDENRFLVQGAEGKLSRTELQKASLGTVFRLQASGLDAAHLLGVLAPAFRAESDRSDTILKLGATGLVAGIVVGLALVAFLEAGAVRRRREELGQRA